MTDDANNTNPQDENQQEQPPQENVSENINSEPAQPEVSQDAKNMAMLCHLLGLFTVILGPLLIWLLKKDKDDFINKHGKESLNFQLTVLIISSASSVLTVLALPIIALIFLANIILRILASIAASKGKEYKYPFSFKLIK